MGGRERRREEMEELEEDQTIPLSPERLSTNIVNAREIVSDYTGRQ